MGAGKLLTALVIFVLNFVLMIMLESKLERFFRVELVIIVVGILFALILLAGIAAKSRWAWPLATVFFSLSLANAVFLFWNTRAWLSFMLLLLFNVFGLLLSVLSAGEMPEDSWEPEIQEPLQTYNAEPKEVSYTSPKVTAKKAKKKK